MTRPRGEIRQALSQSAWELAANRRGSPAAKAVNWREITAHAQVGWQVGRHTVVNMARAGELVKVCQVRMKGSARPMTGYLPAAMVEPKSADLTARTVELTNAVNSWAGLRR